MGFHRNELLHERADGLHGLAQRAEAGGQVAQPAVAPRIQAVEFGQARRHPLAGTQEAAHRQLGQDVVQFPLFQPRGLGGSLVRLVVAGLHLALLQLLPAMQGQVGEIGVVGAEQRRAGQDDFAIATHHPFQRGHAPGAVAVLGLRMQLIRVALAEPGRQRQGRCQGIEAAALQPGLAQPGGQHQVLAALAQQLGGQALHCGPVAALEVRLPDPGGQAGVIFPAQLAKPVPVGVVAQARATGRIARDRLQQFAGRNIGHSQAHGVASVLTRALV
ncbi:hypothetical protein D9M69_193030 [compost metagenome]